MTQYETAFLISPNLEEEETEKVIVQMAEVVSKKKGKMINEDRWGKRKLAYPIKKFEEAFYVFFHYEGDSEIPSELERRFKQSEAILRYLTVKKELKENIRRKKKGVPAEKKRMTSVREEIPGIEGLEAEALDREDAEEKEAARKRDVTEERMPVVEKELEDVQETVEGKEEAEMIEVEEEKEPVEEEKVVEKEEDMKDEDKAETMGVEEEKEPVEEEKATEKEEDVKDKDKAETMGVDEEKKPVEEEKVVEKEEGVKDEDRAETMGVDEEKKPVEEEKATEKEEDVKDKDKADKMKAAEEKKSLAKKKKAKKKEKVKKGKALPSEGKEDK